MNCSEVREFLDAYADDELDVVTSRRLDEHLEQCARCRMAMDRIRAVRAVVAAQSHYYRTPAELRAQMLELVRRPADEQAFTPPSLRKNEPRRQTIPIRRPWLLPGLATAAVILVAFGCLALLAGRHENPTVGQVLTAHVRSLQPNHLLDVVSTNQHTVKPWFDTHLDFSPPVPQLAPRFVLEGGRLDYLEDRPVAALVYRHGGHIINLFVWPGESGRSISAKRGFNLIHWSQSGMTFWAISDLAAGDLDEFAALFGAPPASRPAT